MHNLYSAMAMTVAMNVASPQALLAVSTSHRNIAALRRCALPPLRSSASVLPRRLVLVRATSQVEKGSTSSSKSTVPDTEVSNTKETEEEAEEDKEEKDVSNAASDEAAAAEETSSSTIQSLLQGYKEALTAKDEGSVSEYERELEAIYSERDSLGEKVNALIEEIGTGKDRYLRLNADFDNYRKRAERDRLATAGNVKGEVIESLLPMVDNFERAKTSIKTETEGEVKIDNSYQGIYKQFVEIMKSLGVVAVETVGKNFDPNLHEAIMREDSTEFAEDVVSQEFRRGFRIGDRLLRPAMVKVSSGPGPSAGAADDVPVDEALANE